jgi:hypothetical protein
MEYAYNSKSLGRHGVCISDVNEILAMNNVTTREFDMPLSGSDNLRIMFVGYTFAGCLVEIGVEFMSEHQAYVFHGQTVSPKYRKLYQERIGNE